MQNNLQKNSKNELIEEILKLREELHEKNDKIKELEWQLNTNTSNSSKPSSIELLQKKTQVCNSRIKWQKPRGWVKWHIWANHKLYENPDFVEILEVKQCEKCAFSLEKVSAYNETKRQIIDIPNPVFSVTEYRSLEKHCPCCHHVNKAKFPVWVEQEFQFWPNIQTLSVYNYNYQMTSFKRLQEYWQEVFWLKISQTTLMSFNKKSFWKLENFETRLKNALVSSSILNSDETWVRVNWKTHWIHTAWTKELTCYFTHTKRWKEAMDEMKILEFFTWILVSDHWKSYKNFANIFLHCFCNAHHLRELQWVIENEKKQWAEMMKKLLLRAKHLKEEAIVKWEDCLKKEVLDEIHKEFKNILVTWKNEYPEILKISWKRGRVRKSKWLNLLERLVQNEDWTLGFIHDFNVPFDNNLAERDLRMVKTRTKISGCFRSVEGAKYFCRMRSYISTMRKQWIDIYDALYSIFNGKPILPQI